MSTEYYRKFDEMKKYIPFLESMIKRLESTTGTSSSNPRLAQLDKIRSLRDLLLDKKKRMKMENLLKCEQVLINLYAKVEQRDSLPSINTKSDNIFDVESPSPKEKTNLDSVRNKLKAVTKLQEEETLPEIARANQIEESTVGKEPALFQRRPNKSPVRHSTSKYTEDNVSHQYSNQTSKRNYTRVLVSPEGSPSRRQLSTESSNKLLYKRRSPRNSPRDYSPSYNRKDRKKTFKRAGSSRRVRDLNITLNVPEESLNSLNTEDILSRIINCSDGDVDIDTLRELRSQILGELKETGTSNDISDLLLKSYKKKKKKPIFKKEIEVEEGEISDSESEAIESIYGSLVVVDKDTKTVNEAKKLEKGKAPRKIQICLVINSDKKDSGNNESEVKPIDISNLDLFEEEPKTSSGVNDEVVSKTEISGSKTDKNTISAQSDSEKNTEMNSAPVQSEVIKHDIQAQLTEPINSEETFALIEKSSKNTVSTTESESVRTNDLKSVKHPILNESTNKNDSNHSEHMSKSDKNTVQFKANFYKPLNDEESTEKNDAISKSQEKSGATLNIPSRKDNSVVLNTSLESATAEVETILDTEKNVDIPLLNEPSIPKNPEKKTIVSEIDILQALKNEILSESIAIPGSDTTTPPLHQPKLTKVASAKEILHKKRISIEKYKEKSVSTTVKNMLRKDCDIALSSDSIKKTKIKLTEKECERFNLPSRISLDEQLSSDDEDGYNSDILLEDVYGDLAPRSPDDTSIKEMDISPPVIIPADPVKETTVTPKADVDMRTLPPIISPNPSIDSNCSSTTKERNKETRNDNSQIQRKNTIGDPNKLPLDPRMRKELLKKDSPNSNLNHERTPRSSTFSNPSVTPIMTPNSRSYEMTPSRHSFEVDIPSNRKHVYAPFASSFEREHSISRESRATWDHTITPEERIVHWEENKIDNRDCDSRSKYVREPYQRNRHNESNYRNGPKIDRYKIDRRGEFRPEHSSTPGSSFGWSDNSSSFSTLEAPMTPVVGFGRSDCLSTPSHPFGRSDCPTTPIHPFGRSDCPATPNHPFGRSDCPTTPSHSFGRSECPTTPSHPFGRSDCPTTPSHPFGRSDCPTTPSHSFGRSEGPMTPIHPFGRSDCPTTPSHPFGRSEGPMTPIHPFGRSDCPSTPSYQFGRSEFYQKSNRPSFSKDSRWKGSDYENDRESSKYRERNYDRNNTYKSQNRYNDSDSRYYQRDSRIDQEESSRYAEQGRSYNRDIRNNRDRNERYDDSSRTFDNFRSTHKFREKSSGTSMPDDPRCRQRATSVGRNVYSDTKQNKILSVQPEAGRSFKIDTSVNTTFQNFIASKGLQMISPSFDARRSRATSVGRSLQRDSSVSQVHASKPVVEVVMSNFEKNEKYRRASSVGRDTTTFNSDKSLKDIKADFVAFKAKINFDEKKPVKSIHSADKKNDRYQHIKDSHSGRGSNELHKNIKQTYSPRKNVRDPRMHRELQDYHNNYKKNASREESYEKKTHGIIYSSDNIAKGTVLGSSSGVKNYKIPKLKSVIEEKEREERLKREKEEQERKEKEEKERREKEEKEKLVREKKEQEEKERKEKEEKLRLEKEEKERKQREDKERMEKLEQERKERKQLERDRKEKIEKERIERDKVEKAEKERKEKERERIEHEERECKEKEERERVENLEKTRLEANLKDKNENKMNEGNKQQNDKEQLNQLTTEHKLTDDENLDLDSPTKRITRSCARMVNLDSSDEIKPKKLTKSLVFDSDSDFEENLPLKNKSSATIKPKKDPQTSPVKHKKPANSEQADLQSTFEVDELEMFGENVASDPVIKNINALIADLDNDIDTTKTDCTENFKNEISLENMLENITSSKESDFKDLSKNFLDSSVDKNSFTIHSSPHKNANDISKKDNIDHAEDKITNENLNTEHTISMTNAPKPVMKFSQKAKVSDELDDRSNDGCSTPDSTIVNDVVLEKSKELSTIKAYSNESNSDVTSTLDTEESSTKDNLESNMANLDGAALGPIGSLLSILQDKSKIKELLTLLKESDNEKMKKKLEKLSELVSDDDDNNDDAIDGTGDKKSCNVQNETQNDNSVQNNESSKQNDNNSEINPDNTAHYSISYALDKSITEKSSEETVNFGNNDENKSDEGVPSEESKENTEKNTIEKKSKGSDVEDKFEQSESNTDNLEENDSVLQESDKKKPGPAKKNKTPKNPKGKYIKKPAPKQTTAVKDHNAKPKRKTRNELQKLQEDIQEMFMCDDILNSTGIRMCRLAKFVDKKHAEQKDDVFQDPKPVVLLNKCLDSDKIDAAQAGKVRNKPGPKSKHISPVDMIKDNKLKIVTYKPGPKSKTKILRQEESDPYAFETDSVSESTRIKESDTESDTSDSENCSLASSSKSFSSNEVILDLKKKKRKRGKWQTGVIRPKYKKKQTEQKQVDHTDELVLPQRDLAIPDLNCFVDKMYCFQKNLETYSCRLCVYTGTDIILHYKQKHPHTEIPLSRFNPIVAKEAIEQSENINFQAFSKVPSKSYTCRFCSKVFSKSKAILEKFFWHVVSTHTGEYKKACSECVDVSQCPFNLDIPPPPKDVKGQLIGYICEKCNFTQISLENLKTHVIVRHNDEQTVVYTINLSAMSKNKLTSFIRRCNATPPRTLRSTRSVITNTVMASDDHSDIATSETDTQTTPKRPLVVSPMKSNDIEIDLKQTKSKITFESEDTNTNTEQDLSVKIEDDQLNYSNETNDFNDSSVPDIALGDLDHTTQTEENAEESISTDITAIAHFKVSYTKTGTMEYVCCINGDDHFRTIKLISLKQHARRHTENWDGYCILCKVIVTPQGAHKFNDCLQHFIDIHMGEFPIMERPDTSEVIQTHIPIPVEPPIPAKPYINVRPLSDLISKPMEESLREHSTPSPIIESVVSLTQTVEPPRPSPNYPSTSLEKMPERAIKYEEWQALVMSKKHRVVLGTMMTKCNLVKVFKCAGRFCSFTSDNAEEALLHASTHQRIGGQGAMDCAYCDFDTSNNAIDLVMHVFKVHGRCQYACGLCFYRAAASQLVGAHIANAHPNSTAVGNVLRTTSITNAVPEDTNVLSREKAVRYYVCAQDIGLCKFRTYTPGKLCEHLMNKHKPPYICGECKESVAVATDLTIHMKIHGFMLYQCTWCVHGADKEADLIAHVASNHPDKQPQAYIRIITNKDGSTEFRVLPLAYLNKSKVPTECVTPSKSDEPIREADRSLELEKLIGHTTMLFEATMRTATEEEDDERASLQSSKSEQSQSPMVTNMSIEEAGFQSSPSLQCVSSTPSLDSTASLPIASLATQSSSIYTSGSSSSVQLSSIQTPALSVQSSVSLPATNITTPLLSISTSTLPTGAIPTLQSLAEGVDEMVPVIKIEPIEPSIQITDVVLSDSDDEDPKNNDVISVSDDEPETTKANEVLRHMLLKCPGCKAVYISLSAFMRHVIQNGHAVGAINCPHSPCNRSMNTLKELIDHYHADHATQSTAPNKERYNCTLCGTYCKTLVETKLHLKSVHNVHKMRMSCSTDKPGVFAITDFHSTYNNEQIENNKSTVSDTQEMSINPPASISSAPTVTSLPSTELATITHVQLPLLQSSSLVTASVTTTTASLNRESGQHTEEQDVKQAAPEQSGPTVTDVVLSDSDDDTKQDIIDLSDEEPVSAETSLIPVQRDLLMKCPGCLYVFKYISGLSRHLNFTCRSKWPLKCPHSPCTKILNNLQELRVHYDSNHDCRNSGAVFAFNCTKCHSSWKNFDEVKMHMSTAHGIDKLRLRGSKKRDVCNVFEKSSTAGQKKLKENEKQVYGPEDIERLPIKPILDKSVRCSLCKFNTKVRLNMVRHLQLHLNQQHVPQTAPVNPVPHLESNEKHFDKMLNLASSSIMTRPDKQTKPDNPPAVAVMIPSESAAKYPKYVPERQRLTCGAKGCSYISVDEAMLKCHWDTLHSGTNDYHCVHCPPYQHLDTTRPLTASRVITHLKMHDVTLYACSTCPYYHYLKNIVEKHLNETHNGGNVLIVREEAPSAAPAPTPAAPTMDLKPWQCGLCKFKSMLHPNVVEHCAKQHNSKMQFKCGYCPFRTSTFENVTKHQANSHSNKVEDVFYYYYREGSIPDDPDGIPRWVKQRQKMPEHVVKTEVPDGTPSTSSDPAPAITSSQVAVDLNKVKKENEESEKSDTEMPVKDLCARYGDFCVPNGLKYKCSLCKVVCLDTKEAMESHLYEELQYRKWGCGLCSYKAFHLAGLKEHMAAEHGPKRQDAIKLPADGNLERWVHAYLEHQEENIQNSRKTLDALKQAAAKAAELTVAAPTEKSEPEKCQYSHEDLMKTFGAFGTASEGKYCCPKCDFVSTEYDVIKGHLEDELGKIRWTCSTCGENFLTYHQAQYHCRSAHPTVSSRPNPAARQQDMRTAWINVVIETQKQGMSSASNTLEKSDLLEESDNSLLVVRYEESVTEQEQETSAEKRKRPTSDSDDDSLIIAEPEPKKRNKVHKCKHCNYKAHNKFILYHHTLRHFNLHSLTCNYCTFSGAKHSMLAHMRISHPSLPISHKPTPIPDEAPTILDLKVTKNRPKEDSVICMHCEQSVPKSETLNHSHENVIPEFVRTGSLVMKCCVCLKLCTSVNKLKEHHNANHPDIPMNYALQEMGTTKGPLCCNICSETFDLQKDLYTHQRTKHGTCNDVMTVEDIIEVPSPKRVAKKSTTKLPKLNPVAKKSTTKLPYSVDSDEYSYYGTKPLINEYDNVTTMMPFCNTVMSFSVKKLNEIININPKVVVEDVANKINNV